MGDDYHIRKGIAPFLSRFAKTATLGLLPPLNLRIARAGARPAPLGIEK
ncbi:MAG: hypothetical protein ACJA06_000552 [Halocynthiibacter sp.]|jgi:hypothetical protein